MSDLHARKTNPLHHHEHLGPTVNHGGEPKVMIWACLAATGP